MNFLFISGIDIRKNNACTINFFRTSNVIANTLEKKCFILLPNKPSDCQFILTSPFLKIVRSIYFDFLPNSINILINLPKIIRLIHANKIDTVYIRANIVSVLITLALRLFSKCLIITEHNGFFRSEFTALYHNQWLGYLFEKFQSWDARLAHLTCVVIPALKDFFISNGSKANRIFVSGNATDVVLSPKNLRTTVIHELNLCEKDMYIGFIGNLVCWQGVKIAIDAFKKISAVFPHVKLLIAGDGPELKNLLKQVSEEKLDAKVIFLNEVHFKCVSKLLSVFDIAIAPFTTADNSITFSPLKICDYAAAGKAIIVSDVIYTQEKDWFLACRPGDAQDLAEKLSYLINDPKMIEELGKKAYQYARVHFNITDKGRNILNTINALH